MSLLQDEQSRSIIERISTITRKPSAASPAPPTRDADMSPSKTLSAVRPRWLCLGRDWRALNLS